MCASPSPATIGEMRATHAWSIDLHWIPLGAGGHFVRLNGRIFEAVEAARGHRPRRDLYHAALIVRVDGKPYAIELAPAWGTSDASRGVVSTGAVGSRNLGRWRLFRYELRCWPGGCIPDLHYAVGRARRVSSDPAVVQRLLDSVASVPTPVWGRDELRTGEMWNSNSVIAWLMVTAGIPAETVRPPAGGRAPGWRSGLVVATRSRAWGLPSSKRARQRTIRHAGGSALGG
jgi:hypothetical protein